MRKLIFGMNVTLDGYIAAPGDPSHTSRNTDIGWSVPSDELFQCGSTKSGRAACRCTVASCGRQSVAEITRLKAEDGGPMRIGGATLAGAAMRAGLIDEYALATYPVLVGAGTPFFTTLDSWVNLNLVETRPFPGGVVLTRYETKR